MLPKEDRAKAKANCTESMVTFDVYFQRYVGRQTNRQTCSPQYSAPHTGPKTWGIVKIRVHVERFLLAALPGGHKHANDAMPPALGEDSHQLRRHHSGLTMVLSVRGRGTEAPLTVGGGRPCAPFPAPVRSSLIPYATK